ncbi:hypothetical protein Acsp04_60230 [Actinomadura sp. NBRC 104425]|nr:hypothetical protein Acsp04_60230 [Actinomadura sp. NBRC 104425]
MLIDHLCGRAALLRLPPGMGCRTASLRIAALEDRPHRGDVLTARAEARSVGKQLAVSTGEVRTATARWSQSPPVVSPWYRVTRACPP